MKIDKAVVASIILLPETQATGFLFMKRKGESGKQVFIAYGSDLFDASQEIYVKSVTRKEF
jgi:hypothetical protein